MHLFLSLLHQLHLGSSGIRSRRLGTPDLIDTLQNSISEPVTGTAEGADCGWAGVSRTKPGSRGEGGKKLVLASQRQAAQRMAVGKKGQQARWLWHREGPS